MLRTMTKRAPVCQVKIECTPAAKILATPTVIFCRPYSCGDAQQSMPIKLFKVHERRVRL